MNLDGNLVHLDITLFPGESSMRRVVDA